MSEGGTLPNCKSVSELMRLEASVVWGAVNLLTARGYISKYHLGRQTNKTRVSFRMEPSGALLVAEVERAGRTLIEQAGRVVGAKPKRKYVRKNPKPSSNA